MTLSAWRWLRLAAAVAAPLLFALIPRSLLDSGIEICLFRRFLGWTCPGCGMTRALHSLINGDLSLAMTYNPRVVVVAPILAILWIVFVAREVRAAARPVGTATEA